MLDTQHAFTNSNGKIPIEKNKRVGCSWKTKELVFHRKRIRSVLWDAHGFALENQ